MHTLLFIRCSEQLGFQSVVHSSRASLTNISCISSSLLHKKFKHTKSGIPEATDTPAPVKKAMLAHFPERMYFAIPSKSTDSTSSRQFIDFRALLRAVYCQKLSQNWGRVEREKAKTVPNTLREGVVSIGGNQRPDDFPVSDFIARPVQRFFSTATQISLELCCQACSLSNFYQLGFY